MVKDNGPTVYVYIDNKVWDNNDMYSKWAIGHESLHTAGLNDQVGPNGSRAYKFGTANNQKAFSQIKGTEKEVISPDHLMDLVY